MRFWIHQSGDHSRGVLLVWVYHIQCLGLILGLNRYKSTSRAYGFRASHRGFDLDLHRWVLVFDFYRRRHTPKHRTPKNTPDTDPMTRLENYADRGFDE